MSEILIDAKGVSKKFCRSLKRSMLYGTTDLMLGLFSSNGHSQRLRTGEFWALKDVSFTLKRGDTLGLMGKNGCGKSTLLRVLNGILSPDEGSVAINGRIGALIAVGAGFHPHMTGRENIFLNGTLLGLKKSELKRKFDQIVDFAEIDEFLDAPVATYSSGMRVRLGFAIAIHADIDILLVDEVLAVGDMSFRGKCYHKIKQLKDSGTGIILVSHDTQNLLDHCKRGLLLRKGSIVTDTEIFDAVKEYERLLLNESEVREDAGNRDANPDGDVVARARLIRCDDLKEASIISPEEPVIFSLEVESLKVYEACSITLTIITAGGITVLRLRNDFDGFAAIPINKGKTRVDIRVDALHLDCGVYKAFFVIAGANSGDPLLMHAKMGTFTMDGNEPNVSVVKVWRRWSINGEPVEPGLS